MNYFDMVQPEPPEVGWNLIKYKQKSTKFPPSQMKLWSCVIWHVTQRTCSCRVENLSGVVEICCDLPSLVVSVIWIFRNSSTLPKVLGECVMTDLKVTQRRRPTGNQGGLWKPPLTLLTTWQAWRIAFCIQLMNLQITNFMKVPKWGVSDPWALFLSIIIIAKIVVLYQIYLKFFIILLFVLTSPATVRLGYFFCCVSPNRGFDLLPFGRRVSYSLSPGDWTSRKWSGDGLEGEVVGESS